MNKNKNKEEFWTPQLKIVVTVAVIIVIIGLMPRSGEVKFE